MQISGTDKAKMELLTIVVQAETIQPELSIDPTVIRGVNLVHERADQVSEISRPVEPEGH